MLNLPQCSTHLMHTIELRVPSVLRASAGSCIRSPSTFRQCWILAWSDHPQQRQQLLRCFVGSVLSSLVCWFCSISARTVYFCDRSSPGIVSGQQRLSNKAPPQLKPQLQSTKLFQLPPPPPPQQQPQLQKRKLTQLMMLAQFEVVAVVWWCCWAAVAVDQKHLALNLLLLQL